MPKVVGFTGTRSGMTFKQSKKVMLILHRLGVKALHHGDCVGADEQVAETAGMWGVKLYVHPPIETRFRAYTKGFRVFKPRTYLQRNRIIVECTPLLIAAPKRKIEELHSGTWATIREAGRAGKPVVIVWPDGTHEIKKP